MEDLQTENKTLAGAINEALDKANQAFQSASDGKTVIASSITAKGVNASKEDTFPTLASKIDSIETDKTGDATATAADILAPKDAYVKGQKIKGTIPSKGAATITPTTSPQTIVANQYLSGAQTIAGVSVPVANVLAGVTIAGALGTMPNNGALNYTITSNNGQYSLPLGYTSGGVIKAVFANLVASNIRDKVNVGGVVGTLVEGYPLPPSQRMKQSGQYNIRIPIVQVARNRTYMIVQAGSIGTAQHSVFALFHIEAIGRAMKLVEYLGSTVPAGRTLHFDMNKSPSTPGDWSLTYLGNDPNPYIEWAVFEI